MTTDQRHNRALTEAAYRIASHAALLQWAVCVDGPEGLSKITAALSAIENNAEMLKKLLPSRETAKPAA